jgi:LuxR family glucitol operon transcriptional activator
MRQIAAAPPFAILTAGQPLIAERARPWHNLPQRSYTQFVGRQAELEKLTQLLLPHPHSRHFVLTLDGIGGVGKSALALELAYRYRDNDPVLPVSERFDAIVWVSAKRTLLTASGIQQRQQTFNTLSDLYRELATVLDLPGILQAEPSHRRGQVERTLTAQRTLLIVDNLETVDDEELLTFLREIPDPTKVIVTTRHRIDIAYAIRITGMPRNDALALMEVEAWRKGVELPPEAIEDLFRRTGGIPLAIVWSIGLMSMGHSVESVLRRLGSGQSDIARFCFAESMARIRGRDPERLLFALALFERSVSRQMLGAVAGLNADLIGRDDGLAELQQLSLIDQNSDRFKLLPLTHSFALEELASQPELERELRERWIECLTALALPFNRPHWHQPDRSVLRRDGEHLVTLARWAEQHEHPDLLLPVASALGGYYDAIGRWDDMNEFSVKCIAYARLLGERTVLWIELNALAWTIGQQGRYAEAAQAFDEALALAVADGDLIWQSEILVNRSQLSRRMGRFEQARINCDAAMALLDTIDSEQRPFVSADILIEVGKIARDLGDWATAQDSFQAAREVFQIDLDNPGFNMERAWGAYSQFAYVSHQLGNLDEAARMYGESIHALREVGSRGYLATILVRYAALEAQRGNTTAAHDYASESLELSRKLGMLQERAQAEALITQLDASV